jgi:endonuclease/exonuclease/phosphatase family metal-dependent hydrolase
MRIVTWNACKGPFDRKSAYVDHLHADVAVIQEIARPKTELPNVLWFGTNPNQGVAVIAKPPYTLKQVLEIDGIPRWIVPIEVEGPRSFLLFAVWTLGLEPHPYVCAASVAIDLYRSWFDGRDVVLLGDFNSNAIWDKTHPADLNHTAMVRRLDELGIVSAYHELKGERHGEETAHTFYLHWNESKRYHIDYCFLPKAWIPNLQTVDIGTYAAWRKASDHRPILIELADA